MPKRRKTKDARPIFHFRFKPTEYLFFSCAARQSAIKSSFAFIFGRRLRLISIESSDHHPFSPIHSFIVDLSNFYGFSRAQQFPFTAASLERPLTLSLSAPNKKIKVLSIVCGCVRRDSTNAGSFHSINSRRTIRTSKSAEPFPGVH